jgi:hypothetical protein
LRRPREHQRGEQVARLRIGPQETVIAPLPVFQHLARLRHAHGVEQRPTQRRAFALHDQHRVQCRLARRFLHHMQLARNGKIGIARGHGRRACAAGQQGERHCHGQRAAREQEGRNGAHRWNQTGSACASALRHSSLSMRRRRCGLATKGLLASQA